ncbi:hypothetical protein [Mesorhizobium sp. M0859]|uniref:hypothetical protein n=1 Tax=Mesorhizobium sp. M0859 TaxID=2957014 RepID=UPI00333A178D
MATIEFKAYHAKPSQSGFSIIFHLDGTEMPFPRREMEVRTTGEAIAAFEVYKSEASKTGKPIAACMSLTSGRAPNGFNTASRTPFYHGLNV